MTDTVTMDRAAFEELWRDAKAWREQVDGEPAIGAMIDELVERGYALEITAQPGYGWADVCPWKGPAEYCDTIYGGDADDWRSAVRAAYQAVMDRADSD